MEPKYNVTIGKDEKLFTTYIIRYASKEKSIFTNLDTIIKETLKKYSIEEEFVESIKVNREAGIVIVLIQYRKIKHFDLDIFEDTKDKINSILKRIGFSEEQILDIECEESWKNGKKEYKKTWFIKLCDNYNLDTIMNRALREIQLTDSLREILEIDVHVSIDLL